VPPERLKEDETLRLVLVTAGDPQRLTGGHLYHRRIAETAPRHGACLRFAVIPERPLGLAAAAGAATLARLRTERPDALLVDSIATAALALPLRVVHVGVPVIGVLHQPPGGVRREGDGGRDGLRVRLDRAFAERADRVIVPSATLATMLRQAGISEERLRVVPPGHDLPEPVGPVPDLRRGSGPAVLCVANWLPAKGIDLLLEAFARLPDERATLHLVGETTADPAYARTLRARLAAPDLQDRVVVHGPRPPEVVAAYLRGADVFVLASWSESYGMAVAEAMAAGLPVVATRVGHLPCLVTDGVTGLLVPPGDADALGAALGRLVADAGLRRAMGAAAARRAASFPRWDDTAAGVLAVVREAIAGERGA